MVVLNSYRARSLTYTVEERNYSDSQSPFHYHCVFFLLKPSKLLCSRFTAGVKLTEYNGATFYFVSSIVLVLGLLKHLLRNLITINSCFGHKLGVLVISPPLIVYRVANEII